MNKRVIYTSLTGNYDSIPQYDVIDSSFDYICFSNDFPEGSKQGIWTIKAIPISTKDNTRQSRYVKIMPHKVLNTYDWSIWLDANLIIIDSSIYTTFIKRINEGGSWYGIKHPQLNCIYDDAKKCIVSAKGDFNQIINQIHFLKHENYPKNNGLFENNIIIRQHNNPNIIKIDCIWWNIYQQFSNRDQLSLFYVFWKLKFVPELIFSPTLNSHNLKGITFKVHKQLTLKNRVKRRFQCYYNRLKLVFSKEFNG